jgi:peptide deformylase
MLLKVYQTGQPILRAKAKPLNKKRLASKEIQDVIDFMIATLRDAPGVGIAAPQVGEPLQIIVIEDLAKYHDMVSKPLLKEQNRKPQSLQVLVNPSITVVDPELALFFEGCMSIDNYLAAVPRHKSVKVKAWDRNGKEVSFTANGWHARIVQHEMDHLNGVLYIDTMKHASFMSIKNYSLLWRKSSEAKIKKTFDND